MSGELVLVPHEMATLEQTQRISRHICSRMKIYHIEIHRFMDTHCGDVAYTSVTHFKIRTAFQGNKEWWHYASTLAARVTFYTRPNHGLWCSSYFADKKSATKPRLEPGL